MTEQFRPRPEFTFTKPTPEVPQGQFHLTRRGLASTLNESPIMDNGQNEQLPRGNAATLERPAVDPQKIDAANQQWERVNRESGRVISVDELRTQQLMAELGIGPHGSIAGTERHGPRPISGGSPDIDLSGITDQEFRIYGNHINRFLSNAGEHSQDLQNFYRDLLNKPVDPGREEQKALLLDKISQTIGQLRQQETQQTQQRQSRERQFSSIVLNQADYEELDENPQSWIEYQFGMIYSLARQGQEANSPALQNLQHVFGDALRYLNYQAKRNPDLDPAAIERFNSTYNQRMNALYMRTAISRKSLEQVKGSAMGFQSHGIFYDMQMENGRVNSIFNRMVDVLEDMRLQGVNGHVTSEMVARLQNKIVAEQFALAKARRGLFAGVYEQASEERGDKDEYVKAVITSSTRLAYDLFVITQQEARIAAKGEPMPGVKAFYSDVSGIITTLFNYEANMTAKWGNISMENEMEFDHMKLDMGDDWIKKHHQNPHAFTERERIELGKREFKNIFAVPDFFSSGWRIDGIVDQIGKVMQYEQENAMIAAHLAPSERRRIINTEKAVLEKKKSQKFDHEPTERELFAEGLQDMPAQERQDYLNRLSAEDKNEVEQRARARVDRLGLFLKLKSAAGSHEGRTGKTVAVWEKIRKYRPEEMVRILQERDVNSLQNRMRDEKDAIRESLYERFQMRTGGTRVQKDMGNGKTQQVIEGARIKNYFDFKNEYGSVMHLLREQALNRPLADQVDFAQLTPAQKALVDSIKGSGKGEELEQLVKEMQMFLGRKQFEVNRMHVMPGNRKTAAEYLTDDWKFSDIYQRTMNVDDALLNRLEVVPENSGIVPLSQIWSTDQGGDALVRNINDLTAAQAASDALLRFLTVENLEEKTKAATEFAQKTAEYNGLGPGGQAKVLRYTLGTFFGLSKADPLWNVLGVTQRPFRHPTSELQRIYGPQAKTMTSDELRTHVDHLRGKVVDNLRMDEEFLSLSPKEQKHKIHEAEAMFRELERKIAVDGGSIVKRKMIQFVLYLIATVFLEGYSVVGKVAEIEKSAK